MTSDLIPSFKPLSLILQTQQWDSHRFGQNLIRQMRLCQWQKSSAKGPKWWLCVCCDWANHRERTHKAHTRSKSIMSEVIGGWTGRGIKFLQRGMRLRSSEKHSLWYLLSPPTRWTPKKLAPRGGGIAHLVERLPQAGLVALLHQTRVWIWLVVICCVSFPLSLPLSTLWLSLS